MNGLSLNMGDEMNNRMIECPECGNIQPIDSQKCYKCGFHLDTYLAQINKRTKVNGRNNPEHFYEISPQWQAYVDRQNPRKNSEENDGVSSYHPFIIIGDFCLMVLAVFIGFMFL